MDEFASLFAFNVVGVWWKNRSEIEAAHRATHETMFRDSRLEGDVSSVVELAQGLASIHYSWTLTGASAPDGTPVGIRKGILLLIVQEGRSGWRIKVLRTRILFLPSSPVQLEPAHRPKRRAKLPFSGRPPPKQTRPLPGLCVLRV
ncbi:hypothetical protein LB577_00770 [Mesorhizobium sp. B283B1A]|uniref:hypothetical protein n=1 Tax=Mesorhizobium TaxID=68287 RepID=UPI001CD0D0D0|nr:MULTISPECIES: hypothetical protein [Mesorhizobium]MCA0045495.1 hypothetical protein [Mesorhizobium sp. B283B1A]UQS68124.1 hypothetical protein M5D98_25715 [Mesorhizobium opportunistum]